MEKTSYKPYKSEIQGSFLESIRSRIPGHLSLSDELAALLNISRDSAYRRIREETILSLDEVHILCNRYNLSIDALLSRDEGNVSFEYNARYGPGLSLQGWLESIVGRLKVVASGDGAEMIWHAKDLPIFHYFQFPRLAAFKFFWWINLAAGGELNTDRYEQHLIGSDLLELAGKIWNLYSRIRSTEIISRELINTTLRQIEYSYDSGSLDQAHAILLCKDMGEMLQQLEHQIQSGTKSMSNEAGPGEFQVYVNELQIGDDTILFKAKNQQTTYVTHNHFNILSTLHPAFCQQTERFMNTTIQRSVLISRVAQKERIRFFNRIRKQVDDLQAVLSA